MTIDENFILSALEWYYPNIKFEYTEYGIMGKEFILEGICSVKKVTDEMIDNAIHLYRESLK